MPSPSSHAVIRVSMRAGDTHTLQIRRDGVVARIEMYKDAADHSQTARIAPAASSARWRSPMARRDFAIAVCAVGRDQQVMPGGSAVIVPSVSSNVAEEPQAMENGTTILFGLPGVAVQRVERSGSRSPICATRAWYPEDR